MPNPAPITFPYARQPDEHRLSDVAFGRSCVASAYRAEDPDALGEAVEALARAVAAETVAILAVAMQQRGISLSQVAEVSRG